MLELTSELREEINKYLSKDYIYFDTDTYLDGNVNLLMQMIHNFQYLNHRGLYLMKQQLLKYQAGLMD